MTASCHLTPPHQQTPTIIGIRHRQKPQTVGYISAADSRCASTSILKQSYLKIRASPLNDSTRKTDISNLTSCLHALQSWFCLNGMALNPDKSDAILLGTRQCSRCYASLSSADVAGCSVSLSDHIKILGITLDSRCSLDRHIGSICKSAYYHIRSLCHIRSARTDDMAKSVASCLVCSCLDYAKTLFSMVLHKKISIGSSASKTRLPESLPVTLSDKTHTHLINISTKMQ